MPKLAISEPLKIIETTPETEGVTVTEEEDQPYRESLSDPNDEAEVLVLPPDPSNIGYCTVESECFRLSKPSSITHLPSVLIMNETHIINEKSDLFHSINELRASNDLRSQTEELENLISGLKNNFKSLEDSHASHSHQIKEINSDLEDLRKKTVTDDEAAKKLDAKVDTIEFHKDFSEKRLERRDEDELKVFV